MRLSKKADRLSLQAAQIEAATAKGYNLETYKGMKILTATQEARAGQIAHALKVYYNTAAKPDIYRYYRTAEQRTQVIDQLKKNYDRRQEYKEECKKNPTKSTAANAAAAIREELKQFKGIKFSVTSDNFANGNSVNINWTDGPTEDEVKAITGKYQYGHFNGMEDIYEYSNSREDIPQAKYISENRKQSEATRAAMEAAALEIWPGESWDEKRHREQESRGLFNRSSLPAGATVTGIEPGDEANRWKERLIYSAPDQEEEARTAAPVEAEAGTIQVIEHPFRKGKILVIGETRPIKDTLKSLGGWWNRFEKGWEFKAEALEKITQALSQATKPEPETIPEERAPLQIAEQ